VSDRVVLAVPPGDPVGEQARVMLAEAGVASAMSRATSSAEVVSTLAETPVDVVVLHERLGPMPVLELARDLNRRHPDVGMVLVVEEHSSEVMRAAMYAGVRAVVALPLALEELSGAVTSAGEWSAAVRARMERDVGGPAGGFGELVCVAGAKGGVGATVVSVLLARHLATARPDASVCLVDLDVQTGDVRSLLDITHRRSVLDLVAVVDELTTRHLDETLFRHAGGFRVLLPPTDGELAEDLDAAATRRVLGRLRTSFDVVVVDVGSVMTPASATAADLADRALVVTTTDVPSLRGANRLLAMWDRLQIRPGQVTTVINRVARDAEIQPDLCNRVLKGRVAKAAIPSRFRDLEAGINTGEARRFAGPVLEAVADLAAEVGVGSGAVVSDDHVPSGADLEARVLSGERGQSTVEFVAIAPLLALVVLAAFQLAFAGWTQVVANNAAREAAHHLEVATVPDVGTAAAERVPERWRGSLRVSQSDDRVTVEVGVPAVIPGFANVGSMSATAGAVRT
jgi:pilus assembly protein CpaE